MGRRGRLTAWMSEDPDLVHSDVARMTLQRDRFKYHLQHTRRESIPHRQSWAFILGSHPGF